MHKLTKKLHAIVGEVVAREGFSYSREREAFVRRLNDLSHVFQVRAIPMKPGFEIEPGVGIRSEAVEAIFHRTSGFAPRFQMATPTVGAELWRIVGDAKAFRFRLASDEELEAVSESVISAFHAAAMPYFERYSSLAVIDRMLNDRPAEPTVHRPMPWLRASTGLIVAKLTGRPNIAELAAEYHRQVERLDRGFYLPQFDALIDDLEATPR